MKIKILLVEDQLVVRAGFRALIHEHAGLEVVGETGNGAEAIEFAGKLQPHVILMDIELRDSAINGIHATRRITAFNKDIRVIALSTWDDAPYIRGMVAAGACGYLSKTCSPEELLDAVETVMAGGRYFSKDAGKILQEDYVNMVQNPLVSEPGELTARELHVLRFIALGENSKEIADRLKISPKTVDAHRRKVMNKLDLHSIADLTKYAIREKIIQADE